MYSSNMADKKLDHLSRVKMFSSLNKKELGLVARASDVLEAPAGTELVKEGEIGHEFFLISAGSATVRRAGRKVATLGPGNYFGEMALLDRGPRSATVITDEPSELIVLGQREFMAILDQVPPIAHKLLVGMAGRLREADTRAVSH
jgi:CRP/FNR family cyclic AMP-dependent transcriptional regulator